MRKEFVSLKNGVLGIDVGGVIIVNKDDDADTSFFGKNYLTTPAMPDAFDVIGRLQARFDKIVLVSKCGSVVQAKTREWLEYHRFYELTNVDPADVYFCRERHEKAPICERLGVTHFVDDRLEVLSYLKTVTNRYLFCPNPNEVRKFGQHLSQVHQVESWAELSSMLTA